VAFVTIHLADLIHLEVVRIAAGRLTTETSLALHLDHTISVHLPGTGAHAVATARTIAAALTAAADSLESQLTEPRPVHPFPADKDPQS